MTNEITENKNTDTVAQVRERLVLTFGGEGYTSLPEVEAELDALIASVRAEEREAFRLAALADEIMRHETPDSRITRRDVQITELKAQLAALREQVETERMRLAVCGIAAHGGHVPPQALADYGSDSLNGVLALRAENARLVKEADDLSEANWIMQKRLAMAEAEIVRLGAGG